MGSLDIGLLGKHLFSCGLGKWKRNNQKMDGASAGKLALVGTGNFTCYTKFIYAYQFVAIAKANLCVVAVVDRWFD